MTRKFCTISLTILVMISDQHIIQSSASLDAKIPLGIMTPKLGSNAPLGLTSEVIKHYNDIVIYRFWLRCTLNAMKTHCKTGNKCEKPLVTLSLMYFKLFQNSTHGLHNEPNQSPYHRLRCSSINKYNWCAQLISPYCRIEVSVNRASIGSDNGL